MGKLGRLVKMRRFVDREVWEGVVVALACFDPIENVEMTWASRMNVG
jgi:hypothetical protein